MTNSIAAENEFTAAESELRMARLDSLQEAGFHHMLMEKLLLHVDAFQYNIVLRSKKYGNMFFVKAKWRKRAKPF